MDNSPETIYPDPGEIDMKDQHQRGRRDPQLETLQRARRIETRLTQLLVHFGITTQAQKPEFDNGRIYIPSKHTPLLEVIDAIPENWSGPIGVFIEADQVAVIDRSGG